MELPYILLPKSDLTIFDKLRFNSAAMGCIAFQNEDNQFDFSVIEGENYRNAGITYRVSRDLSRFNIFIGDKFQVARDSLVSNGLIPKPYSNTKEYENILKKQIKYWDGKEFKGMYL